jgi:16S rRNA (guanine527-N7)-methyltransferase
MSIPDAVADQLQALQLSLRDEQLAALDRYLTLLLDASERVNLTAVKDRDMAWRRLLLDSLTLAPGLEGVEAWRRVVDVGSGGGLPGIPLAIARPDLRFTLLEATGKKARCLESFAAALDLSNVTVVHDRAEAVGHQREHRATYDVAVCRAVGSMREIVEYMLPLLVEGGRALALKATQAEAELEAAGDAIAALGGGEVEVYDAYPAPRADDPLVIIVVTKANPTPRAFPRAAGLARHSPL